MPYYIRNANKPWETDQIRLVKQLVQQNTPTRVIALKIGKTVPAIRAQATKLHISLKPTNQSPYGRRVK